MNKHIILLGMCLFISTNATYSQQKITNKSIFKYNKSADQKAVKEIIRQAQENLLHESHKKNDQKDLDFLMSYINSPHYKTVVYKTHGKPVGVITYFDKEIKKWKIPFTNYYLIHSKQGVIQVFAVDKNHRKKGYGSALLLYVLQQMKDNNMESVLLNTNSSNKAAIKLYERNGFKILVKSQGLTIFKLDLNTNKPIEE